MNKNQYISEIKKLVKCNDNKTYFFSNGLNIVTWYDGMQIPTNIHKVFVKGNVLYINVTDAYHTETDNVEKMSDWDVDDVATIYSLVSNNK